MRSASNLSSANRHADSSPATTILTGEINSGKTTRMMEWYRSFEPGSADGIASRKIFRDGLFIGYEAVRLCDGCATHLALRIDPERIDNAGPLEVESYTPSSTKEIRFGQFLFSREAFLFAEAHFYGIAENPSIKHIFLDEIGPMELQGRGFSFSLRMLLSLDRHLIVCVRANCIDAVVEAFHIQNPEIVHIYDSL